MEMVNIWVS